LISIKNEYFCKPKITSKINTNKKKLMKVKFYCFEHCFFEGHKFKTFFEI